MSKKIPKYSYWGRVKNRIYPMIDAWTYGKETRAHYERLHTVHRREPPDNVIPFPRIPEKKEQG